MTSVQDTMEVITPAGTSGTSVGETLRSSGIDRPPVALTAHERHEINTLALRMQEHHRHLSLAAITAFVEQAHLDLAGSRVQSFRMILTERAVRRRLASASGRA